MNDDPVSSDDLVKDGASVARSGDAVSHDVARPWQPSRNPLHRSGALAAQDGGLIMEVPEDLGLLGMIRKFLRRRFVRPIIGLTIFILAAIIYDHTLDGGSWTIKAEKAKPAEHKGAKTVPLTPEQ